MHVAWYFQNCVGWPSYNWKEELSKGNNLSKETGKYHHCKIRVGTFFFFFCIGWFGLVWFFPWQHGQSLDRSVFYGIPAARFMLKCSEFNRAEMSLYLPLYLCCGGTDDLNIF